MRGARTPTRFAECARLSRSILNFPKDLHPMTQFSMAILACQKESQFAQRYQVRAAQPACVPAGCWCVRWLMNGGAGGDEEGRLLGPDV
jgi:hypothetical protein